MGKTITNKQIEQLWDDVLTPNEDAICALGFIDMPIIDKSHFPDLHFVVEKVSISDSDVKFHTLCLDLNISGIGKDIEASIENMISAIIDFVTDIPTKAREQVLDDEMRNCMLEKYWAVYRLWNRRLVKKGRSISQQRKEQWLSLLNNIIENYKSIKTENIDIWQIPAHKQAA